MLFQSSSKEIELFEWAGELAQSLSDASQRRRQLEETVRVKDLELNDLRGQLEELSEAKAAHENQLLEKFRQLLNSKKMKIRDQQRLLARASIDPGIGKTTIFVERLFSLTKKQQVIKSRTRGRIQAQPKPGNLGRRNARSQKSRKRRVTPTPLLTLEPHLQVDFVPLEQAQKMMSL